LVWARDGTESPRNRLDASGREDVDQMAATSIEGDRSTIADGGSETRELTLFVSGASELSVRAIAPTLVTNPPAWG
jgi:hypothetical protein